jgi:adenylosuccinate lyase
MSCSTLKAISPLDGRYQQGLSDLRESMSEYGLIKARVTVEVRWFQALAAHPAIPEVPALDTASNQQLEQMINHFSEDDAARVKTIEQTTRHDVKAVEYFLKERFADHEALAPFAEFIHFACTSEDINNLSYALMLQTTRTQILAPALKQLIEQLDGWVEKTKDTPMLSRTHGQPASPTLLGKEIAVFRHRLQRQLHQLDQLELLGKINGAVGCYNAHHSAYPDLCSLMLCCGYFPIC